MLRLRQLPYRPGQIHRIAPIVREAASEWTPDMLRGFIARNEIPESYVALVVRRVKNDPSLIIVEKPDFLAAVAQEYPDLYPILTSPEGDAWFERCLTRIAAGLVSGFFDFFKTGGTA